MIFYVLKLIVNMLINLVKKLFGTTKMVLVVRTDIKMGSGKIASQCAHAAITLYESSLETNNEYLKVWLRTGQPKIVLKVHQDAENTLRTLYDEAKKRGLNACLIHDAGRTQIEKGCLTVLGVGPNLKEQVDEITCHLKLL